MSSGFKNFCRKTLLLVLFKSLACSLVMNILAAVTTDDRPTEWRIPRVNNYVLIAIGVFGLSLFVYIGLLHKEHKNDQLVIASYVQEIATLKADATARASRDKSAAAVANSAVNESTKEGNDVLSQTIPSGCEDVRMWAIKQSQGM